MDYLFCLPAADDDAWLERKTQSMMNDRRLRFWHSSKRTVVKAARWVTQHVVSAFTDLFDGVRFAVVLLALVMFATLSRFVGDTAAAIVSGALSVGLNNSAQRQREIDADRRIREREIEGAQRQRKIEGYEKFMETFFRRMLEPIQKATLEKRQFKPNPTLSTVDLNIMTRQLML